MSKEIIGLEIDGDSVTLVEVRDGYATSMRVINNDSLSSAVKLALSGYKLNKLTKSIRVVFSSVGTNFKKIDVTEALFDRKNFEDAVFTAMPVPRESNTTSGMFFDKESMIGNTVSSGIAMVTPASQIEELYKALGKINSEVVSPPAVFGGLDGIWVSVRNKTVDITLVSEGRQVAYRQLRTGGLDALANKVGESGIGRAKIYSALNRNAKVDPVLDNEIRLYDQNLANEIRQTVDYWQRTGEVTYKKINVIGIGANLLGLEEAIFEQNFTIELNDDISKRLVQLPVEDRLRAVTAYLAAMTTNFDMPQISYVNPFALSLSKEKKRKDKRAKQFILSMLAVGALVLVTVLPYFFEKNKLTGLEKDLKTYQTSLVSLDKYYSIYEDTMRKDLIYKDIYCKQPDWDYTLLIVYYIQEELKKSTIKNLVLNEIKIGELEKDLKVTFVSELKDGNSQDLTNMLSFLRGVTGVDAAWSDSFTFRDGKANYNMSFTLKNRELLEKPIEDEKRDVICSEVSK